MPADEESLTSLSLSLPPSLSPLLVSVYHATIKLLRDKFVYDIPTTFISLVIITLYLYTYNLVCLIHAQE